MTTRHPSQSPEPPPDASGLQPAPQSTLDYQPKKPKRSFVDHPVTIFTVLTLALPTLGEQFLNALVGLTDTIVAGHTVVTSQHDTSSDHINASASAAVGIMTYLQWFAGLMTSTLGVGATAIVARSIGAKRPRIANRVAGTACAAAFLTGILIALVFFFGASTIASAFRLQNDAHLFAVQYLRIMCLTICFQTAGQIGMACLRGAGDTFRPMLITIAITLVNGIASPALTWGWFGLPKMGVQGNATGTLFAFAVAGIATFFFLFYGDAGLKLRLRHLKIVPHLLRRIARIGIPSWFESMLLWGGQFFIVIFVMGSVDDAVGQPGSGITVATHNAVLRIESLAFLPGFGFGIAGSALVGQYLGAKKPDQAHRAAVLSTRLAFLTMCIAAIPMVLVPRLCLYLTVDSRDVVNLGVVPLIIAGLAQPGFAIAIAKSSALKGAGDTVSPLISTVTGIGGRVILVLVLIFYFSSIGHKDWGLIAVWICIFLDLSYRAVFMELVFRRGKWKTQKV